MNNKKLNIHIDSNYIKPTTNQIPDELKELGVNVYNEKEFEKGVLLQVDLQLAEYELNQIQDKIDSNPNKTDLNQNDNNLKRKNKTFESYQQKKAKLDSKIEDYKNYLEDENENLNDGNIDNSQNKEDLIKLGEMTPFGTRMDFQKGTIFTLHSFMVSDCIIFSSNFKYPKLETKQLK